MKVLLLIVSYFVAAENVDFLEIVLGQLGARTMGFGSCRQRENWIVEQSVTGKFSMCPDLFDFIANECYVFQSAKMGLVMASMGFVPNGSGQLDFFKHCKSTIIKLFVI